MLLEEFLNKVRKLYCLDFHDLVEGGCFNHDDTRWGTFRSDPVGFLLMCDDETAAKIWAVACKVRQQRIQV